MIAQLGAMTTSAELPTVFLIGPEFDGASMASTTEGRARVIWVEDFEAIPAQTGERSLAAVVIRAKDFGVKEWRALHDLRQRAPRLPVVAITETPIRSRETTPLAGSMTVLAWPSTAAVVWRELMLAWAANGDVLPYTG